MNKENSTPLLHLYPHSLMDEVVWVGNRKSLSIIRDTIDAALENGEAESSALTTALSEKFTVRILLNEEKTGSYFWEQIKLPYGDLEDESLEGVDPLDLLGYEIRDSDSLKRLDSTLEVYRKRSRELQEKIVEIISRDREKDNRD